LGGAPALRLLPVPARLHAGLVPPAAPALGDAAARLVAARLQSLHYLYDNVLRAVDSARLRRAPRGHRDQRIQRGGAGGAAGVLYAARRLAWCPSSRIRRNVAPRFLNQVMVWASDASAGSPVAKRQSSGMGSFVTSTNSHGWKKKTTGSRMRENSALRMGRGSRTADGAMV